MKKIFIMLAVFLVMLGANAQKPAAKKMITNKEVEISCGECQFKMKGKGCDLAVRIDGKSYFVDGKKIDDFGDAHADDGFCHAVRKANVTGEIVGNRFKAKNVELLPAAK